MSPLRTSRPPSNPVANSRAASSVNSPVYHGPFVPAIDVHQAKLIDERRLARERDIASMEKVIMRTTGLKIGAPRLRNISQIRDTVFVDPALIPMEKIGRVEKDRPRTIAVDSSGRSARTQSSMLADLKDLERLRNTPSAQRCSRVATRNETRSSSSNNKRTELSSTTKIRSDIFKIQQMFQSPDSSPRTVVKRSTEKKNEKRNEAEKHERKPGTEINKTRLLAQKLLEASRNNRESLKDRYNNPKNASNLRAGKEMNGRVSSKASQRSSVEPKQSERGKNPTVSEDVHPRPPARRRRESKNKCGGESRANGAIVDDATRNDTLENVSNDAKTLEKEV